MDEPPTAPVPERVDANGRPGLRARLEGAVRTRWDRGRPGVALRAAGALYGLATDVRNLLYDAGALAAARASLPVVSVGGLTVGGSGKTPVTAALAGALSSEGVPVGIATHGFPDEMELHRRLTPEARVEGGGERAAVVERLAARGAHLALLDDGFQHRRLFRDLEVLLLDADLAAGAPLARLPAGPYRDRLSEAARADVLLVVRRGEAAAATADRLAEWARRAFPWVLHGRCALVRGKLRPANDAARERAASGPPDPAVAVAAIMKPERFFRALADAGVRPERRVALPDHAAPAGALLRDLVERAGRRGIAGTLKDVVKLEKPVGERTPLWWLEERLVQETPETWARLLRALRELAAPAGPEGR